MKLSLLPILHEAAEKLRGFLGIYWQGFGYFLLVLLPFLILGVAFSGYTLYEILHTSNVLPMHDAPQIALAFAPHLVALLLIILVAAIATLPVHVGLTMLCIHHVNNKTLPPKQVLRYYQHPWRLLFAVFAVTLIIITPKMLGQHLAQLLPSSLSQIVLLIGMIISFVIMVRINLYLPLIAARDTAIFDAIQISWQATRNDWRTLILLNLIFLFLNIINIFTFFIASIWTIPFMANAYGIVCRDLIPEVLVDRYAK